MMKETKMTFQRLEKKYVLTPVQHQALFAKLSPYLREDEFGQSTICNMYYDTKHYDLITQSLQKPPYKEKLRLRSYGIPKEDTIVYLEIKKKCKGVVNKRRVGMTLQEARTYLQDGIKPKKDSQILAEIDYFLSFYEPIPKVYLAYDRAPYVCALDPSIRITFDQNIRRRYDHLDLGYGDEGETILAEGMTLMEIKVPDAYPLWLTRMLSELEIYPVSFSKYGKVFMEDIVKKERMKQVCSQVY